MDEPAPPVLELRGVAHSYRQGTRRLDVLRGADLLLDRGEMVALVGPSGSGKSTLLHVAGLLETPETGRVLYQGQECGSLGDAERTRIRRIGIGFVYQFHHLMTEFTALENVMIPQLIAGLVSSTARSRSLELLDMVGLADRARHRPGQLSGGEQQRVAIARAFANVPSVVLADEPTGNLDQETSAEVFTTLRGIIQASGLTTLVATHDADLAGLTDRVVTIRDGRVEPAGYPDPGMTEAGRADP